MIASYKQIGGKISKKHQLTKKIDFIQDLSPQSPSTGS